MITTTKTEEEINRVVNEKINILWREFITKIPNNKNDSRSHKYIKSVTGISQNFSNNHKKLKRKPKNIDLNFLRFFLNVFYGTNFNFCKNRSGFDLHQLLFCDEIGVYNIDIELSSFLNELIDKKHA